MKSRACSVTLLVVVTNFLVTTTSSVTEQALDYITRLINHDIDHKRKYLINCFIMSNCILKLGPMLYYHPIEHKAWMNIAKQLIRYFSVPSSFATSNSTSILCAA